MHPDGASSGGKIYAETNVVVLNCTLDALNELAEARGRSRDETLRQLVRAHVERQERLAQDDRITHISTLLRHPVPAFRNQPYRDASRLRLRLPQELAARARAVSLRLPGQPVQRGHRDYQARTLTDAVVTAIARERHFADEMLEGLLPLLRHRSAIGLWTLAVAATTQRPEQEVYEQAERAMIARSTAAKRMAGATRAELVADALRGESVAWHAPWRLTVVRHFARKLLAGTDADRNEQMLYEQTGEWDLLRSDLENTTDLDHPILDGVLDDGDDLHFIRGSMVGRSGTAVWRAERQVELDDLLEWALSTGFGAKDRLQKSLRGERMPFREMSPPGWKLVMPERWRMVTLPLSSAIPEPLSSLAASGQVLRLQFGSKQAIWPVSTERSDGPPHAIDGFNAVLRAIPQRLPIVVLECSLLQFPSSADDDDLYRLVGGAIAVPVHTAHRLGLIVTRTRDMIVNEAELETRANMRSALDTVYRDDPGPHHELEQAMDSPTLFIRRLGKLGHRFRPVKPVWHWRVESLASEVDRGAPHVALEWLARRTYRIYNRALQASMQDAWHRAFERFR